MSNLAVKRENDRIFKNGDFPDMHSETVTQLAEPAGIKRSRPYSIAENTVKETTIQCILRNARDKSVIALNFANAMFAGGGYVIGGNAQEESLCRASMLYYTIKKQSGFYLKNRLHILPDYTDVMIWSENVPVIRDESGTMLEKQLKCGFITCPAVNRSFARFIMPQKRIDRIMYGRMKRIITLAVQKKPEVLILGAFGCGAFGNRREKVLPVFEELINSFVPENIEVIFAIP